MGLEDVRVFPVTSCCCFLFWLVFSIVSFSLSFQRLEQGKFALLLNWSTQQLDDEVWDQPGMYLVGLGNTLLEFPSTYQSMHFVRDARGTTCDEKADFDICDTVHRTPIVVRSADGLSMSLSVSFQWRLHKEAIKPLYEILGHDLYRDEFVRFAKIAVVESCTYFSAEDFFNNRTEITARIHDTLDVFFNRPEKKLVVDIKAVQIVFIELPEDLDTEILTTQQQQQQVRLAFAEREEGRVMMERELMMVAHDVEEVLVEAQGTAKAIMHDNEAKVATVMNHNRRQALANAELLRSFKNDEDPLAKLFWAMRQKAIKAHDESKLIVLKPGH